MKFFIGLFFLLFIFSSANDLLAQDVTFILLRHAEKDVSPMANKADPILTEQGNSRAEKLFEAIKDYKPTQIFSTNFLRTRATVEPSAKKIKEGYRIQTQYYDYQELEEFAEKLLKMQSGTIVVVGHNTTTPTLANLLIKQEKYKYLNESEYNKIFIVRLKNGKVAEDKVIEY